MEDSIGFFDIFWSIFWLFLLVAWFWVAVSVVADIFRSKDMSGWSKAIWIAFVILIPWAGVLGYLIVRGDKMRAHNEDDAAKMQEAQKEYIRSVATISPAEEIEKLAALKEKGALTEEEFAAQKAKILNT